MRRFTPLLVVALLAGSGEAVAGLVRPPVARAADCAAFEQTGYQVCGRFLAYWQAHGGLPQQGYPLSDPFLEQSAVDGKYYQVQYFERAVFEYHPEKAAPNDVLLSLVGREVLAARYPNGAPGATPAPLPIPVPGASPAPSATPSATPSSPGDPGACADFPQTGHQVCGAFLAYWQAHGGLAQQGYPLSPVFSERSAADGQTYRVQYFERAVFELHPDLAAADSVLLSLLGRDRLAARYPYGAPLSARSELLSLGQITLKTTPNGFVEWSAPVMNISGQPLLSLTVVLAFYGAADQLLDSSLAAEANVQPGETRTLHGLSVKGLGYAKYAVKSADVVMKP